MEWAWNLNVCVPFQLTQALVPRLSDGGRVINISSAGARLALPEVPVYSMCKAAVETFTVIMAKILGPRKITVNAVAPGFNEGETNAEILKNPEVVRQFTESTLFGRIGRREDIGGAVLALASPSAAWITGQTVEASGGFRL
jgi:NAD(P)-dependent dehydrogenase (short-subunit alcohol dehydrogenase family)